MDEASGMVDDLVDFWHSRPDKLLDDAARDLLESWVAAGRIAPLDAKTDVIHPDGTHRYWSTHCRHGNHALCSASRMLGMEADTTSNHLVAINRRPAQCKEPSCAAPCVCPCHQ